MSVNFIVEVIKRGEKNSFVEPHWVTDAEESEKFGDLFENVAPVKAEDWSVSVKLGHKKPEEPAPKAFVSARLDQKLLLLSLQGANYVRFEIEKLGDEPAQTSTTLRNVNDVLMAVSHMKKLPDKVIEKDRKDELFNNILAALSSTSASIGFKDQGNGITFVKFLQSLVWYLDSHWQTLKDFAGLSLPPFLKLLYTIRDVNVTGEISEATDFKLKLYNQWQKKKERKPKMNRKDINDFTLKCKEYIQTVWMGKEEWEPIRTALTVVSVALTKYASYLEKKTVTVAANHQCVNPVRSPSKEMQCYTIEKGVSVHKDLKLFEDILEDVDDYCPIFLSDHPQIISLTKQRRFDLFENLRHGNLRRSIVYVKYTPHGGLTTSHFIWSLPEAKEDRDESKFAQLTSEIASNIPQYHTRAMKSEFSENFDAVCSLKPSVYRAMYRYLTGDLSAPPSQVMKEVDERLQHMLLSGDSDLAFDLRELNQGNHTKYDEFWEGIHQVLQRDFPPAAEERRHGNDLYLPVAISLQDLKRKVLEIKPGIDVPCDSWILLQFQPKRKGTHAALSYTSRFKIKYKIQNRSSHAFHEDRYYCMALFKYLRSFAVMYAEHADFFSEDDKHSIPVGEPGVPQSTLVRSRKVMSLEEHEPNVADHDWHRVSLIPSVSLKVDIPPSINDSFYQGDILITLKNAVFQPSSPLRHQVEKELLVSSFKPIQCTYSDGGPDHNPSYYSVILAQICHLVKNNLDMSVNAVTAPGVSYANIVERIMAILNLAMEGVSLQRDVMDKTDEEIFEPQLKNMNTMAEIREKCKRNGMLKQAFIESIEPCIDLLNQRFSGVSLKGEPAVTGRAATEEEMKLLHEHLSAIDDSIKQDNTTKAEIERHPALLEYLKTHTRLRRYMFQIRKCEAAPLDERLRQESIEIIKSTVSDPQKAQRISEMAQDAMTIKHARKIFEVAKDPSDQALQDLVDEMQVIGDVCNICQPPQLPLDIFLGLDWLPDPMPRDENDEKFKSFEEVYRTETKEEYRPSHVENLDEPLKHLFTKDRAIELIECATCLKPRVIYGEKKVWKANVGPIMRMKENLLYTCGDALFPEEHELYKRIGTRRMMRCSQPMEKSYYSCKKFQDVCFHCGEHYEKFADVPEEIIERYRDVYPLCRSCKGRGYSFETAREYKGGKAKKAKATV